MRSILDEVENDTRGVMTDHQREVPRGLERPKFSVSGSEAA
jgi:hypothetical protein